MVCSKCGGEQAPGTLMHAYWVRDDKNVIWEQFKQTNWLIPGLQCVRCGHLELYAPRS